MTWCVIGTWEMAAQGAVKAADLLAKNGTAKQATLAGVQDVEDNQLLITSINDSELFTEYNSSINEEVRKEIRK